MAQTPCTPPGSGLISWWRGDRTTVDYIGNNGLGHYLLKLPHRDSVEARDVFRATPWVGGASHSLVQREDKPADKAWMRRIHGKYPSRVSRQESD